MKHLEKVIKNFENQLIKEVDIELKFKIYNKYIFSLIHLDINKAAEKLDEALFFAEKIKDIYQYNVLLYNKANLLTHIEDYEEAFNLYVKAKQFFFKNNHKEFYLATLSSIGVIFYNLKCYKQALYIWKDNLINLINEKDIKYRFALINNLIMVYLKTYSTSDQIEIQINEIIAYYDKNNLEKDQIYCDAIINLSNYHRIRFHEQKAITLAEECLLHSINEKNLKHQFESYLCFILIYKQLNDDRNLIKYLKKALLFCEKNRTKYRMEDLFQELYIYFKRRGKFKEALNYFEKSYYLSNKRASSLISLQDKMDKSRDLKFLNDYIEKNTFFLNREIFIEDKRGSIYKINIDNIVFVEAVDKITKVTYSNSGSEILKISFKDFMNQVEQTSPKNHILFYLNKRNMVINLYWLYKFDKYSKTVFLNVFGNNYEFEVSRGQLPSLRLLLNNK